MPRLRLFGSCTNEWVSPLVLVARGLVSVGNCVPFPYVNTALSSGLALLELIQTVGKSGDNLKYLAKSVVTIMQLLREEMDSHPTTENAKFLHVCETFTGHLTQLSKDLTLMSKNWSSSKFRKYLNSNNIREKLICLPVERLISRLIAAVGTRMDLAGVGSKIEDLRHELAEQRSSLATSAADSLKQELTRYEEDFHTLKLGDIHLDFPSAQVSIFPDRGANGREKRQIGWTDYKATVNGCVRTVRVYQGSDPTEVRAVPLCFSPHLLQLFGFCSSPKLRSLVFHGEYHSLDEHVNTLTSAQAIVDWELGLLVDLFDMYMWSKDTINFVSVNRQFAMANADLPSRSFITWFVYTETQTRDTRLEAGSWDAHEARSALRLCQDSCPGIFDQDLSLARSAGHLRKALGALVTLHRHDWTGLQEPGRWGPVINTPLCRGCVYHSNTRSPVAQLEGRVVTPEDSWRVDYSITQEIDSHGNSIGVDWPSLGFWRFPVADPESRDGFTHFLVPLMGKNERWISHVDSKAHCGYFLSAEIEFGKSLPDITHAWMAQAGSLRSKLNQEAQELSGFYVPTFAALRLTWEMTFNAEAANMTPESMAILNDFPESIHVNPKSIGQRIPLSTPPKPSLLGHSRSECGGQQRLEWHGGSLAIMRSPKLYYVGMESILQLILLTNL
ncbi:hypothetical protein B0H14DRAFT_2997421 [Mycena olivaceomarginata]|nr:hypothetical protein B0H14DRAFT_2997421 [Mycena olivaceomarginata]